MPNKPRQVQPRRRSVPATEISALQSILLQDVDRIVRRIDGLEHDLDRLESSGIDAVVDTTGGIPFLLRGAQDALVKSETFFRHLVDQAPVLVLRLAPDGKILFANGPAEKHAGSNGRLVTRRWQESFAGDSAVEDWHWLIQHAGEDRDVTFAGPDGDLRVITWRMFCFRDDKDAIVEIFGYGIDITERERIAKTLRESEANLLRAQRIAGVGSIEIDFDTMVVRFSAEAYRIIGVDPAEEILHQGNLLRLVVPEDRDRVLANVNAARNGVAAPIEYRLNHSNGTIRNIYRENDVLFDKSGRALRMIATIKDVTELRESEARLLRSQRHLTQAQRVARIGSFERDLLTDKPYWSDECYRIIGLEPGSPPSLDPLLSLVLPEDRPLIIEGLAVSRAGGSPPPVEFRITLPGGSVRTLHRESELIRDRDGRPVTMLGVLRDVTEIRSAERRRDELEAQLRHAQRLDAIGTLASGIAHDLNNTLVPVIALVPLMMRRTPPESRSYRDLEILSMAGDRARRLVQQILQFCRAEEPEKQSIKLSRQIREVLTMMRSTLPATIRIEEKIDDVPEIFGDPGQLYQVFLNLITNAAYAIGSVPGKIVVGVTEETAVRYDGSPSATIRVSVADSGCGMTEDVRSRIFEPFFTTKPVSEGSGLGLSVVHGIIAGHGGRIAVESRVGAGTRFDVYLPVAVPIEPGDALHGDTA
jgi:PAS domain S-box-containing protein